MSSRSILHAHVLNRAGAAARPPGLSRAVVLAFVGLLVATASLGALAACGSGEETVATTASSDAGQATITDDGGRQLTIPAQINKVFCTSPAGTYLVYTLAPDKLVGWNITPTEQEKLYIPEEYRPVVGLGGWFGKNTTGNVEEIIKTGPDVVLSIGDVDEGTISDADRIQDLLNIPVVLIDSALIKTGDAYRFVGELLGEQERAEELAQYSDEVIAQAQEKAAQIAEADRVTIYYAEGAKGLYTDPEGSTHTEVFTLVGAHNVADVELQQGYGMSPVSLEQVIAWDPEFVFVASDPAGEMNVYDQITNGGDWSTIQAVEDGHVYQIPHGPFDWLDRPYSVARILGIQWVGSLLYPEVWDIDIRETTKEFYEFFYHYELSDAQFEELVQHALAAE
jgi:iron complex transport system substrate-binding protein